MKLLALLPDDETIGYVDLEKLQVKGERGERGPVGLSGGPGVDGPRGFPGIRGLVGEQGIQGFPGKQGIQGPLGPDGARGQQGVEGPVGPEGPIGPKGDKGDQGPEGKQGPQGLPAFGHRMRLNAIEGRIKALETGGSGITQAYADAHYDAIGAAAAKVTANGAIVGATKTKLTYDSKGLVTSGADATTADIAASANKNYVTDAQQTVIQNTSGTNTGDQNLAPYLLKNVAITGATKTKVTYDANGLVTSGADATTADIADSLDKRYVTDALLALIVAPSFARTFAMMGA